ncbi:hypothetical protein GCM10007205_13320 [Oxalicibacterium flavum]|uniref:Uncharacterized protein n=1 Tax=Oxalicibacterium flavum TaxID=179467 RepID=A0A8J2UKJ1_9BURK|nr:hypothetical protein GCM10007205_13320 [Oxalicibacterium flavum]
MPVPAPTMTMDISMAMMPDMKKANKTGVKRAGTRRSSERVEQDGFMKALKDGKGHTLRIPSTRR